MRSLPPLTMCSLPFTQPRPSPRLLPSLPPPTATNPRWKPRVCTRKVRGAKISTPTPTLSPKQQQLPEQPSHVIIDPLYRVLFMISTSTAAATGHVTWAKRREPKKPSVRRGSTRGALGEPHPHPDQPAAAAPGSATLHHCRGFVTADVLEKGLSRGAIATG